MMQIVIDLPETDITKDIIRAAKWEDGSLFDMILRGAIKNAIILPKEHGRLIDADALEKTMCDREEELGDDRAMWESSAVSVALDMFAPTIIEADKESDGVNEMTLDEAIIHAEEVAEEYQRVVDTGIVFDDVTIDMMYCDDTEVIEEHLANYRRRAEEQRQLAKWLRDYERLKEQETCEDAISRIEALNSLDKVENKDSWYRLTDVMKMIRNLPPVTPQPKTGHWIICLTNADTFHHCECSECSSWAGDVTDYCPNCGARMVESQESEDKE